MPESSDIVSRVSVLEESFRSIHADVTEIKQAVNGLATSRDTNWSTIWTAAGVIIAFVGMAGTAAYAFVSGRIDGVAAFQSRLDQRIETKFERLDTVDNESRVDRASTKEALREVETQFRLGKEVTGLMIEKETVARDLAIERAKKP